MVRSLVGFGSSCAVAICLALPVRAHADPPAEPTPVSSPDEQAEVREYEIRLRAHRRTLLEREAELDAARHEIRMLKDARKESHAPRQPTPPVAAVPSPLPSPAAVAKEDDAKEESLIASLQHDLDVEREHRATLEEEIQRLAGQSKSAETFTAMTRSLDGAQAEILVLRQRVVDEQHARESLEIALERARQIAGVAGGPDWLDRFAMTVKERREQSERLEEQLRGANEAMVALKARLESVTPQTAADSVLDGLRDENRKLHSALDAASQANADLQTQADLAARLAELFYREPHSAP